MIIDRETKRLLEQIKTEQQNHQRATHHLIHHMLKTIQSNPGLELLTENVISSLEMAKELSPSDRAHIDIAIGLARP